MPKQDLLERLDQLSAELVELKKALFLSGALKKPPTSNKDEFRELSRQISHKWKGPSVVEEIRQQRER